MRKKPHKIALTVRGYSRVMRRCICTVRRWDNEGIVVADRTETGTRIYYPHHIEQGREYLLRVEEMRKTPFKTFYRSLQT